MLSNLKFKILMVILCVQGLILALNPLCPGARKLKVLDVKGQPIYHTDQCAYEDTFTVIPMEVTRAQVTARALHQTLPASMGVSNNISTSLYYQGLHQTLPASMGESKNAVTQKKS